MSRPFPLQPEVWTRTPHWGSRAMGFPPGEAAKSQKLQVLPARELISPFSAPPRIGDCDPLHSPGGKSLISPTWYGPSHSAFLRDSHCPHFMDQEWGLVSSLRPPFGCGGPWGHTAVGFPPCAWPAGVALFFLECPSPCAPLPGVRAEGRIRVTGNHFRWGGTLTAWICGCTDSCSEPPLALLSWKTASVCLTKSFLLF